jgi:hypothetical protein
VPATALARLILRKENNMGKDIPWSFNNLRGGIQLNLKSGTGRSFTNLASLTAAGLTPAKYAGAVVYASTAGTGSVPCLCFSDGVSWKQIAIGVACI